jgi:hypothetical protein
MKKIVPSLIMMLLLSINSVEASESNVVRKVCLDLGYKTGSDDFINCVIKVASMDKTNQGNQKSTPPSNFEYPEEKQVYFSDTKVNKKDNKLVARYERFPDDRLCISYINKHGVFTKKKQAARLQVIQNRKLDCSQYRDAAYYDKQRRKENIANSTKKLLNDLGEGQQRKADGISRNSRAVLNSMGNKRTCESTRSGNSVSTTCR